MNILRHWKIILSLIAIFLFGVVSGSVLTAGALGKLAVKLLSLEGWPERTAREYRRDLKLTPVQAAKVRAIAQSHYPEMLAIRNETIFKSGLVYQKMNQEIGQLITPEQAARLATINKRKTDKFKKAFKLPDEKGEGAKER